MPAACLEAHTRNLRPVFVLSGAHRIPDVIFEYTGRSTDVVEKFRVRVNVTGEFPFLESKLSPYYDR